MRLINTTTFKQEQFLQHELEGQTEYAILSHRWLGRGEITFKDYTADRLTSDEKSPALDKIRGACKAAQFWDVEWIWIDNVCIDKSSSAELTESINSMFRWYRQAKICIVFLADVTASLNNASGRSQWFERAWTLQELLAPRQMEFYDGNWQPFGSKQDLARDIAAVSGIDPWYLDGRRHFRTASIATRLSWQAHRKATRPEDLAYSLLGILDVSMDARYGEGMKAFMRLQEELIRNQTATDESLFAWTMPPEGLPENDKIGWSPDEWGLLAPSPKCFLHSSDILAGQQFRPRPENGIAKTGDGVVFPMNEKELQKASRLLIPLHFVLPFSPVLIGHIRHKNRKEFTISLNCWRLDKDAKKPEAKPVQIALTRDSKGDQFWRRCHCDQLGLDMKMYTGSLTQLIRPVTVLQPNLLD
jgi:hypothetical protein